MVVFEAGFGLFWTGVQGRQFVSWLNMESYTLTVRKFISSQHVSTGIRITACVLVPALVLHSYGMLGVMMGVPLGALFVALSDQPGPLHHRSNGMIAAILINFLMVWLAGISAESTALVFLEIVVFGFIAAMAGVYGARADTIALIALIAFIISYGTQTYSRQPPLDTAFYFSAGGAWYALFSIITNTIQPYRPAVQSLGEYLIEIGGYLNQRATFYKKEHDIDSILLKLIGQQVTIQQQQSALREILFKTRLFLKQPTNKGRRIVMIFLESTDLLERIMTTQQDYRKLRDEFSDTDILDVYHSTIITLSDGLVYTGLALQSSQSYDSEEQIRAAVNECSQKFAGLRAERLSAQTVSDFIRLRHVLYSIEDVAERILRIQHFSRSSTSIERQVRQEEVAPFLTHQSFNLNLLLSNFSTTSAQFRHAIRLMLAIIVGFLAGQLLPFGHEYWMLLTIATILKPAFSTSRRRNLERVAGTLAGAALAFLTLHVSYNSTVVFGVMLASMFVAYTFIRYNNLVSTGFITLYVVLSFHFLYPSETDHALLDRVINTIIGAAISFAAAYLIFPVWEHKQIRQLFTDAVASNNVYFKSVSELIKARTDATHLRYKLDRKAAFVALANLSDAFQRMLNEPRNRQKNLPQYHQLVTASHMLTSYVAALAYFAEQHNKRFDSKDFLPLMQYIVRKFECLQEMVTLPGTMLRNPDPFPVNKKLKLLIEQRKTELEKTKGSDDSTVRKSVSFMKSINDQLHLINSAIEDMMNVLRKMDQPEVAN